MIRTAFELFAIGLFLNFSAPCFFSCLPATVAYLSGKGEKGKSFLVSHIFFTAGRFLGVLLFGFISVLAVKSIKEVLPDAFVHYLNVFVSVLLIVMALSVLSGKEIHFFQRKIFKKKFILIFRAFCAGLMIYFAFTWLY